MNQPDQPTTPPAAGLNRRSFLHRAALTAAMATPAAALLGTSRQARADLPFPPGPNLDLAILNFALNLEYLEANFYSLGVFGKTLAQRGIPIGSGGGTVTAKSNPQVKFTNPDIQGYIHEITADETAHVIFLQDMITKAGGTPIVQPDIDLLNSFNTLAQVGKIGQSFDPFANETNFLLGGFIFEDVGVTAYAGGAAYLSNSTILTYAAEILAVEAYHASMTRVKIFEAGETAQQIAQKISNVRENLDASQATDQGVTSGADSRPNIVPTGQNGLAFHRSFRAVLNIAYGARNATKGLFFPNGANGPLAPTS